MTTKVEDLAKQVLKQYWNKELPVDPASIARAMKAEVISDDLGDASGQFVLNDAGPVISFNRMEPEVRQRFTIAHELGHYVLGHGDNFRHSLKNFSTTNYDPQEVAANRFAAAILMPNLAIEYWVISQGLTDLKKLAEKFNVSEAAMQYRLKNLGVIS